METTASIQVGSRSVPVKLKAENGFIRVTSPDGRLRAFEGRLRQTRRDRLVNLWHLSCTTARPIRCAFEQVSLERSGEAERLIIDPRWPHDEPLTIFTHGAGSSVMSEWNRGKLRWLDGKKIRCIANGDSFSILQVDTAALIARVRWDDVRAIRTYKRDLFCYDMICLGFQLPDKSWIELWEESDGFLDVAERMRDHFPSVPEKWYSDVMMPPFVTSDTFLYRRDDQNGERPT